MTKGYLYHSLVNRKNKYRLKSRLEEAMQIPSNYVECDVDGCYVSQTSSYVDIRLPNRLPSSLFMYSCIRFTNTDYTDYIAFIDRIEPNNFNTTEDNLYYRLYITIDWWSTLQLSSQAHIEDICSHLEGNVDRAHLDDIEKVNNTFKATLKYTTDEAEEPIIREERSSKILNDGDFLYVFSTKPVNVDKLAYESTPETILPPSKGIKVGLNCYIVPVNNTKVFRYTFGGRTKTFTSVGISAPDIIDDSSVVAIYRSGMLPFTVNDDDTIDLTRFNLTSLTEEEFNSLSPISLSIVGGGTVQVFPMFTPYINREVKADVDYALNSGVLEFEIPINYSEYLNNITKTYFPPYTFITVEKNGVSVVIDTAYENTDTLFRYAICPYIGSYLINRESDRLVGEASISVIDDNSLYDRTSTNDNFTRLSAMANALGYLGKSVAVAGSVIGGVGKTVFSGNPTSLIGAVGGAVSFAGQGVELHSKWTKILRDGEDGTRIVSGSTADDITPLTIFKTKPLDEELQVIRKHLALYGYNTYLHPHEVLSGHQRKYFNYIKTNNALVNVSGFSQEIKMHIEEMFNNGVWLWNNVEEFGNYEVPNYPIIMEEQ